MKLIALAIAVLVFTNYKLSNAVFQQLANGSDDDTIIDNPKNSFPLTPGQKQRRFAHNNEERERSVQTISPLANLTQSQLEHLKTNRPIFLVGFPKVGTTSIYQMFQCSGINAQHYCCCNSSRFHTHCKDVNDTNNAKGIMAACMRKNMRQKQPILQGCGSYELYAQMDGEFQNRIYLPQHFQLHALHEYAPNATMILNIRSPEGWVDSVTNWFGLGGRFLNAFQINTESAWKQLGGRRNALIEIYNNHSAVIRDFARRNPSHPFLELNISDPNIGQTLALAFGLNQSCWGLYNKNKNETQKMKLRMKRWQQHDENLSKKRAMTAVAAANRGT